MSVRLVLDRLPSTAPGQYECCYCGKIQEAPKPPALVSCVGCEKPLRIFANLSGVKLGLVFQRPAQGLVH
jgi:hypothetical protein